MRLCALYVAGHPSSLPLFQLAEIQPCTITLAANLGVYVIMMSPHQAIQD